MATYADAIDMNERYKELVFMLVGKPGIGKSSLANAILGVDVVPVSELGTVLQQGHTQKITKYTKEHLESRTKTTVYDTPGLGSEDTTINEDEVIGCISRLLPEVNIVLFCVALDQDRFLTNNPTYRIIDGLRKRPETNNAFWEKAIIILTRANLAYTAISAIERAPNKRLVFFNEKIDSISGTIKSHLHACNITAPAILPAGLSGECISEKHTDCWLSKIWEKCFDKINHYNKEAAVVLFMINVSRIRDEGGSWVNKNPKGRLQLSKDFFSRHGIKVTASSTTATGIATAVLYFFAYSNPITAGVFTAGSLLTLVVGGASYKWYHRRIPVEDFLVHQEDIDPQQEKPVGQGDENDHPRHR